MAAQTIVRVYENETRVIIYGYDLLAPLVSSASASAAAAAASAAAANDDAADASDSAAAALASEESAGAYLDGVEDLVAGIPLDPILPMQAVSRAILAGFTGMAAGRQAFLSEAGRAGVFKWSTSNHSADVTADPYQGLYVPPSSDTDGSSGAWVRIVEGSVYLASWWGVGTAFGNTAHLPINSAYALIPDGATLVIPNETITTTGTIQMLHAGTICGAGTESHILHDPAASVNSMIQVAASNSSVHHLTVTGKPSNANSGNAANIIVSHNGTGNVSLDPMTNVRVHDVRLLNSSLPLVLFGDPIDGLGVSPVKDVICWNLYLETNVQGFSVFGADDVQIHTFQIKYFESVALNNSGNTVTPGIRVLGSKGVRIHDGDVSGSGGVVSGHNAFRLSNGNLGEGDFGRRANENVTIENVKFRDFYEGALVDECQGDLILRDLEFEDDVADTRIVAVISIKPVADASVITPRVDNVYIENITAKGFSQGINYHGPGKLLSVKNFRQIMNSRTPDGISTFCVFSQFGAIALVDISKSEWICQEGISFKIHAAAGETFRAFFNSFTEAAGDGSIQTPTTGPAFIDDSGAGTFVADQNRLFPDGTWAAVTA